MTNYPVLYSFRRCPYAMRARMALYISAQACILREVVLRDKPDAMVSISPKATVPVLETAPGEVIEQSLEIMLWALNKNDPAGWLTSESGSVDEMILLIDQCETDFKPHLDRYKYANRYDGADPLAHRGEAEKFLGILEKRLSESVYLFGARLSLADFAIAPFMRQFANTDRNWFDATPYLKVQEWLNHILTSQIFVNIMKKYAPWKPGDPPVHFPISG